MKSKYIIILLSIFCYNCSDVKEEIFLKNFTDKEKIKPNFNYKKEINTEDLYILNKSEAINEFDEDMKFYYGYKTKISNDSYLILYNCEYYIDNNYHQFALGVAYK